MCKLCIQVSCTRFSYEFLVQETWTVLSSAYALDSLNWIELNRWQSMLLIILPKVFWEEGRIAALSHMYAVKSPLVTMACPKFAPKSTPSRGPIPKPHYLPHPWTRPTYGAKQHPDPIRRFPTMHWTDRQMHRPTDRPRESVTTIGRCATRATRPNNTQSSIACLTYMSRHALQKRIG